MKLQRLLGALCAALFLSSAALATEQASYVTPASGPMAFATFVTTYLNPGLRALASCSWGPAAPANGPGAAALPYQTWCDTTTNPIVVKMNDGAAWVVVGKLDGVGHGWTPSRLGTDLGTASTATTGTSGHALGFLDIDNTWTGSPTFSASSTGFTVYRAGAAANAYSSWKNDTRFWVVGVDGDGSCGPGVGTTVFAFYDQTGSACRGWLAANGGWVFGSATVSPGAGNLNLGGGELWNNGTPPTGSGAYVRATAPSVASPAFTGTPTTPTAAVDTSTTQVASTGFVTGQAAAVAPPMDGAAAIGSSTRFARADHVHPTDTSRAPLASPALTGTPTAPTAAPGTNTTQLATTAYADAIAALKANIASPTFTGVPAAPTAAVDTSTTQVASTGFVIGQAATAAPIVDGTAAVGSSTRFARADHVHPTDTSRAPLASPALTGTPTAPTAAPGTNTTQLATTAYADAIAALKANAASPAFSGTASGANVFPNAVLAQAGAATFKGNPTNATANVADFTIQGLTARGAPDAANDKIPLYDNAAGSIKYVTPAQIAASATAGVSSIAGNTGAFTLANGLDNSGNQIQLTAARRTLPTVQKFISGTGTYTTPANVLWIEVELVGGGGGGGGGGTAVTAGTTGGTTTFGTSLLSANGGTGAATGSAGGTASLGTGPIGLAISGTPGGGYNARNNDYTTGGNGANSPFGGAGVGTANAVGSAAAANTGSGGGGGGTNNGAGLNLGAAGGASGGYVKAIINSPAATYSWAIGSGGPGGAAGTNGFAGGTGGTGFIIVREHYGS